jgi:hypothetical protein
MMILALGGGGSLLFMPLPLPLLLFSKRLTVAEGGGEFN